MTTLDTTTQSADDFMALSQQLADEESQRLDNTPVGAVNYTMPTVSDTTDKQPVEAQSTDDLMSIADQSGKPVDDYVPPQDRMATVFGYDDDYIPTVEKIPADEITETEEPLVEDKTRFEKAVDEADNFENTVTDLMHSVDFSSEEEQAAIEAATEKAKIREAMLNRPGIDSSMLPEIDLDEDVIVNNARRDKAIETLVIPNMEDGAMKDFLAFTGADGFESMISLGMSMQKAGGFSVDVVESFFETWQDTNKTSYDFFQKFLTTDVVNFEGGVTQSPKDAAEEWGREMMNLFTALEAIPVLGAVSTLGRQYKNAARAAVAEAKNLADNKRLNLGLATANAAKRAKIKKGEAAQVANTAEGIAIKEQLIMAFEQRIGARSMDVFDDKGDPVIINENLLISVSEDGVLKLDNPKARDAARAKLNEFKSGSKTDKTLEGVGLQNESEVPDFIIYDNGELTIPTVKADNIDAFTAIAKDILDRKPDLYDPKKPLIDNLFEMSVNKDVVAPDELLGVLNKYGINFEEYATMILGSASEAGRVLNKFSQISQRVKPASALRAAEEKKFMDNMNGLQKFVVRVENIRRGLLVSQLATAMRNLSSAGFRAPLQGLENMMDTALYNMSEASGPTILRLDQGLKTFVPGQGNWTGSFRHMRYMFDPTKMGQSKEITDYVLTNDKFASQFDSMFNTINEIRRSTGKGQAKTKFGRGVDGILNVAEAGVDVLNLPNRWQEFLIRRGAFSGELERLVKREYGIDLIQALNEGRLPDLINDAPDLVGKNKRSFTELVGDATNAALDITYAKSPEIPVFQKLTSFITQNGLTAVVPFPRFMFNSMELAGNYTAGGFAPVIKRSISAVRGDVGTATGKLTKKERQQISRNIVGATVILPAAMMYRDETINEDGVPSDYKMLKTAAGLLDSTPQSPIIRQALWVAEFLKRKGNGTARNWLDFDDIKQTWLGTNVRTGVGGIIFEDITKILTTADDMGGEKGLEYIGKALGEYSSTFLTPMTQVVELQRMQGKRTSVFTDVREESLLGTDVKTGERLSTSPVKRGFLEVMDRRGISNIFDPSSMDDLPARETIFQKDDGPRERIAIPLKVFGGLGMSQELSEAGQFMEKLGYRDFKIASRTVSKGFNQFQTRFLRKQLPLIVELAQSPEFIAEQKSLARQSGEKNVNKFIKIAQISFIDGQITNYKNSMDNYIADGDAGKLATPDGSPIDVRLTQLVRLQQQYRRLRPSQRDKAWQALPALIKDGGLKNKEPNLADIEHLTALIKYAKKPI